MRVNGNFLRPSPPATPLTCRRRSIPYNDTDTVSSTLLARTKSFKVLLLKNNCSHDTSLNFKPHCNIMLSCVYGVVQWLRFTFLPMTSSGTQLFPPFLRRNVPKQLGSWVRSWVLSALCMSSALRIVLTVSSSPVSRKIGYGH